MELTTLTYIVVGASFALYIGIAIWSRASNTSDFYVAGKHVHPVANGMATAADWMSAASFISMAGLIAYLGYDGSVYLMGWTGGYVLLALLLAPYLRKFGKFTVPEFIGERYDSRAARIVAVICLIVISFTYVAGQMRGVGIVFSRFLEVPIGAGLVIGMGVVFTYAVLGGMKGITNTQIAQYCVLIFAYTVPAVFIALQITGMPIPQIAFGSTVLGDSVSLLEKLDQVVTALGFPEYTSGTKGGFDVFCITMALMIGTAGLPHVIVRFFTVPKVRDARYSAGWALLFIGILYLTAPAVGSMARLNLMETIQTGPVGAPDSNLLYEERPDWFRTWEGTGLLVFDDRNGDGRIQYYNDQNPEFAAEAEALGWNGNELQVDRDIIVLANPEIASLPDWVIALVAAGGIAAALVHGCGVVVGDIGCRVPRSAQGGVPAWHLRTTGVVGGADFRGRRHRHRWTLGLLPAGVRGAGGGVCVRACRGVAVPADPAGDFLQADKQAGGDCGDADRVDLYVCLHRVLQGAVFAVGRGAVCGGCGAELVVARIGVSPEGIGALGMVLNFAVALTVSRMTAPPPERVQALVEYIRAPR